MMFVCGQQDEVKSANYLANRNHPNGQHSAGLCKLILSTKAYIRTEKNLLLYRLYDHLSVK